MILTDTSDTICAISTPPGIGGIAVARISGPQAIEIADKIWKGKALGNVDSHTTHLGMVIDRSGRELDQAVATVFRTPRSFTGEDVVELSVHGSKYVQREIIATIINAGARLAEPGEFTRRAFASGRMDLAEAEAVADVIASNSRAAHRIAISQMRGGFSRRLADLRSRLVDLASLLELELDFSEEDVEFASRERITLLARQLCSEISRLHNSFAAGNAIKEGIPVAIVGATNAGKSSLLNALLGDDRAIVSDIHGTTRDTIEETIEIGDYQFRFIDTAGIRDTADRIEQIGIQRSINALRQARIIILVIDPQTQLPIDIITQLENPTAPLPPHTIVAINKTDIATAREVDATHSEIAHQLPKAQIIDISANTGHRIDRLTEAIEQAAIADTAGSDEDLIVTNARHAEALHRALQSTDRLLEGLDLNLPGDLLAQDLRETLHHLATITGQIPSTEILQTIFSRFCIGK